MDVIVTLEFTNDEMEVLLDLIQGAEQELIQSLGHTDTRAYKTFLRDKLNVVDRLKSKMSGLYNVAGK